MAIAIFNSVGIRYEPDALVSTDAAVELKPVRPEKRRQLVADTFAVAGSKLTGRSVLLVDDIIASHPDRLGGDVKLADLLYLAQLNDCPGTSGVSVRIVE